jgi:hypothetical protein
MDGPGGRLQRVIEEILPEVQTGICHTIESLAKKLRMNWHDLSIAVLFANTQKELQELISLHELFSDTRVILIAPDDSQDTISKAHILRPRFLTYSDSNFNEIVAVLRKMIGRVNSKILRQTGPASEHVEIH